MKVIKERNAITIRINTPKSWFLLIFGTVWLTFWTIGGIAVANALIRGTQDWYFYVFWLCGWIISETYVMYAWLWNAFGVEIISIRDESFVHIRHVFGFGRRRTIPLHKLTLIHASGPFPKINSIHMSFRRGVINGTVAVRLRSGRTYRIGMNLDQTQANQLVAELKPYFLITKPIKSEKPADA